MENGRQISRRTTLVEEWKTLMGSLSEETQETLLGMIRRSLDTVASPDSAFVSDLKGNLDEVTFLHGMMKDFKTPVSMPADFPELIKQYSPRPSQVVLPAPAFEKPSLNLFEALQKRRSYRDFSGEPLTLSQLSQILFYTWGLPRRGSAYYFNDFPFRSAPSAGGLQPIEVYCVANAINSLAPGLYHYQPLAHSLELLNAGLMRRKIVSLLLKHEWIHPASVVILLSCVVDRMLWKYGARGYRYMHADAGFVGQNIYLTAAALGLGTSAVAGFDEDGLNQLLNLNGRREFVVLAFPIGVPSNREP